MKITPRIIARALIDLIEKSPDLADQICDGSIALLKQYCSTVSLKNFLKIAEKEVKRRGDISGGMLVVPNQHSISAETVASKLKQQSGRPVEIDRKIDPDLIGGAVLLVDHRRIDSSVQGALQVLLKQCLQPLD